MYLTLINPKDCSTISGHCGSASVDNATSLYYLWDRLLKKYIVFFMTWCVCYWKKSLPFALLWHCIEEAKGMLAGQIVPIKWWAKEFKAALADLHLGDETSSSSCHSCVLLQLLWKNKSFSETDLKTCWSLCKGKRKWPSSQLNTQKWLLLIEV